MRVFLYLIVLFCIGFAKDYSHLPSLNVLTDDEARVIIHKGTERPFTGKYYKHKDNGVYTCKQCDAPLYESSSKFDSGCGWPSFDDEIQGAIRRKMDADGHRIEILCANCGAHLGHVFKGEGFTQKNIRHCVNSISLNFESKQENELKKAYFAGGCFWGVEYHFEKLKGVKDVVSGYMGGRVKNPTYMQVVRENTGHKEVVEVTYDPKIVSYESLVKLFFEIHDATQTNGQGPDIGEQYKSAIFTSTPSEKMVIRKIFDILRQKGIRVATLVYEMSPFYKAEVYHQDYYQRTGKQPYCHAYKKIF